MIVILMIIIILVGGIIKFLMSIDDFGESAETLTDEERDEAYKAWNEAWEQEKREEAYKTWQTMHT